MFKKKKVYACLLLLLIELGFCCFLVLLLAWCHRLSSKTMPIFFMFMTLTVLYCCGLFCVPLCASCCPCHCVREVFVVVHGLCCLLMLFIYFFFWPPLLWFSTHANSFFNVISCCCLFLSSGSFYVVTTVVPVVFLCQP